MDDAFRETSLVNARPKPALLAPLALVPWLAWAGAVHADEPPRRLTIVVASDLDGALAPAQCGDHAAPGRHLGHLAASIARARADAEAEGRTVIAVLQLGDLSGPAAVGRYLLSRPDGARRLAEYAAHVGFSHAILGNGFFDRGEAATAAMAEAFANGGVPQFLNATIDCDGRTDCAALAALPPRIVFEAAGIKLALVGGTSDNVWDGIDAEQRLGLVIRKSSVAFDEQARLARAEGARLVIAATHVLSVPNGLAELTETARAMDDVDLLLANQVGEAPHAALALVPEAGASLAASGESATTAVRIDLDVRPDGDRLRVAGLTSLRVASEEPDPKLSAEMRELKGEFCAALDHPLPARAERAIGAADFLPFVLDAMREVAQGELALLNRHALDRASFPLEGPVSAVQVFAALPFDDVLVRGELSGAKVRELWKAGPEARRKRFAWAGITERDGVVWVNERPLDDSSLYLVATTDFLARGGDGLITQPSSFNTKPLPGRGLLQLRDLVLDRLSDAEAGTNALAGRAPLDLSTKLRWTWSNALSLTALGTRRSNAAAYPDSRLKKDEATALRAEFTGRADGDARDHAVRLSARARYARASVAQTPGSETEDQLFIEALYRLRAIRRRLDDAFWAPVPYVAAIVDTEFVANPTAAFRHQDVGATVGVRFLPMRPLELKFGVGARFETRDPNARLRWGLEAGYDLPRFSPIKLRGLPVDVETGLDYFIADTLGTPQHEGRLRARVLLPLGGPLAMAAGVDAIAIRQGDLPFALLTDATLGITVRFDGARQRF